MRNIKVPNLPTGKVGLVICKNSPETVLALKNLGIAVLSPEKNTVLQEEVSEHADMLCCFTGEDECILSPEQHKLSEELIKYGLDVKFSSRSPEKDYPGDILLNVAVGDTFAIGNKKFTDNALLYCLKNKYYIYTKQGYAKCSTCFVNSRAFITEDKNICSALEGIGADVLLIKSGDIYLSEKHTGFFGGATGKISETELAVNGELKYHTDGEKIKAFLYEHGVTPVELIKGKIKDIGGILPAKET